MLGILPGMRGVEMSKVPALLELRVSANGGATVPIQTGRPTFPVYHNDFWQRRENAAKYKATPKEVPKKSALRTDGWMDGWKEGCSMKGVRRRLNNAQVRGTWMA